MEHFIEILKAYCEKFNLRFFRAGDTECPYDLAEEEFLAAGMDPETLKEMTPLMPIALVDDGVFQVITSWDGPTGDVVQDYTENDVRYAIESGVPLHAGL